MDKFNPGNSNVYEIEDDKGLLRTFSKVKHLKKGISSAGNLKKIGAFMVKSMNIVTFFCWIMPIFRELCDPMGFEVYYAISHHRMLSEGAWA